MGEESRTTYQPGLQRPKVDVERAAAADQAVVRPIRAVAQVLAAAVVLATCCAALASRWWIGELAVHFPVQYAVAGLLASGALLWARRPGWAVAALAAAAINAAIAVPVLWGKQATDQAGIAPDRVAVRAVAINVRYRSRDHAAVIGFIRAERPDFAVFVEMTPAWRRALAALEGEYPHRFATRGRFGRGVVLLSRWPITGARALPLGQNNYEPAVAATLKVGGREVHVIGVHTSTPTTPGLTASRNGQLAQLATYVRSRGVPALVLGDLNVSPFSPHFRTLLEAGGLRSAADGFGWQPTWPTFLPPAGIQIDHALVTTGVTVRRFRRGPRVGSDHRPIVVDLVL